MHKGLFSEFYTLCAATITIAILVIAVVFIMVSSEFYKNDKKSFIIPNAESVIASTQNSGITEDGPDAERLGELYSDLTNTTGIVFTLTDSSGVALVCSEAPPCSHKGKTFGEETLKKTTEEGFFELSSLDHFYDETAFNYGRRFTAGGESYFLFSRFSDYALRKFQLKIAISLGVVSAIMLVIVFAAIYAAVKHLTMPVKEMTLAANRFVDGDYSAKLYIPEDNELGFLANSINEMAASLKAAEENRKMFVSNVSHELRTPMTTIGGFVDGILDGTIPEEKHEYYLRIVSEETERLSRLVRSMLNISKYEAGETELDKERFDLMPDIMKTLQCFENRISEKNIEIQGVNEHRHFFINADEDLMRQVIYNLAENAVKFVNNGGYIRFEFEQNESKSVIRIRNSGVGLKSDEISRVFDRFYKTDPSRGIDKTGVGLGLPIVSSIIKLHGGTVQVCSEPDSFVEFEIILTAD